MFADDTNMTISGSSLADPEQETNLELLNLHCWLKVNKLSLDVVKNRVHGYWLPPEASNSSRQCPACIRNSIVHAARLQFRTRPSRLL